MEDFLVLIETYRLILLGAMILNVVSMWCIFVKAGESGWKALIPIYSSYKLYAIAWDGLFFTISIFMSILATEKGAVAPGLVGTLVAGVLGIIMTIFTILLNVKLANAFEKSGWFAVGLILLPPIFMAILAFGKAKYIGAQY